MESSGKEQYQVKVDGTGRVTSRSRRFLQMFNPDEISLVVPQPGPPLPLSLPPPTPTVAPQETPSLPVIEAPSCATPTHLEESLEPAEQNRNHGDQATPQAVCPQAKQNRMLENLKAHNAVGGKEAMQDEKRRHTRIRT